MRVRSIGHEQVATRRTHRIAEWKKREKEKRKAREKVEVERRRMRKRGRGNVTWLAMSAQVRNNRLKRSFIAAISTRIVPRIASILAILPPRFPIPLPTAATSPFNKDSSPFILDLSASSSLAFLVRRTWATSPWSSVTALPSHLTRNLSFFASFPLPPRREITSFLRTRTHHHQSRDPAR